MQLTTTNRLLNDTPEKGTIFVRVYPKDVFGFIAHLDKINYGLGYTLTMKRANSGTVYIEQSLMQQKLISKTLFGM